MRSVMRQRSQLLGSPHAEIEDPQREWQHDGRKRRHEEELCPKDEESVPVQQCRAHRVDRMGEGQIVTDGGCPTREDLNRIDYAAEEDAETVYRHLEPGTLFEGHDDGGRDDA